MHPPSIVRLLMLVKRWAKSDYISSPVPQLVRPPSKQNRRETKHRSTDLNANTRPQTPNSRTRRWRSRYWKRTSSETAPTRSRSRGCRGRIRRGTTTSITHTRNVKDGIRLTATRGRPTHNDGRVTPQLRPVLRIAITVSESCR